MMCLIGATIGIASIFLPWFVAAVGPFRDERALTAWIWDLLQAHSGDLGLYAPFLIFLLGTLLAFWTPLGGILQALGLATFYVMEIGWKVPPDGGYGFVAPLAVGFYLAVLSAIMVMISMVKPLGIGFSELHGPARPRFQVFSGARWRRHWRDMLRLLRDNEPWGFAWGVTIVLLATIVLASGLATGSRTSMSVVPGGVTWTADSRNYVKFPYRDTSISLYENNGNLLLWVLYPKNLTDGKWSYEELGTPSRAWAGGTWWSHDQLTSRWIGVLPACTIIDISGDGALGPGDSIMLTTTNGASFEEGVNYTLVLTYPYGLSGTSIWTPKTVTVTFEISDGRVSSTMVPARPGYLD
jgi:hypothetical protein